MNETYFLDDDAARPLAAPVPIRTTLLELIDSQGAVCLRLSAGLDGPELTIPADPDVCRGPMTTSLRVLTGGSEDAIRSIGERVADLEDILTLFGATIQAWRGGAIIADPAPSWERRDMQLEAEIALRENDAL
ncbi:MAG: hypothetical protein ABSC31_01780 [Acidimicrobiales bacterium]|jgi:hypothetical protein